jgi:Flp pilus assembly pilin Flp
MLRTYVWIHAIVDERLRSALRIRPMRWREERGQTTAEYALVILAAAAIAIVLITWARSSGKLPAFFDHIIDTITNGVS